MAKSEALAGVLALGVWSAIVFVPAPSALTFEVLDVGQGDALLVTGPNEQRVLIDGGPDPRRLLSLLGERLPFWERRFAAVILSHPDADHLTGLLEVVERYDVGMVVEGDRAESAVYSAWEQTLERQRVPRVTLTPGQALSLGGASMVLMAPEREQPASDNDRSLVFRIAYGEVSFLLTGDVEASGEETLLQSPYPLQSTVLKVAHHGSRSSTTMPFLEAVQPAASVISVGARNRHGHPSPEVLGRLEARPIYRTDENGSVAFQTDGQRLWVRSSK
jgi:competence protein ComEC